MQCRTDENTNIDKCFGRLEEKTCFENSDCDRGLFCERSKIFPYESTCEKLRTTYELCQNTEECQLNLYCWYGYKEDVNLEINSDAKLKKCLPMFSQFPDANFGWRRHYFKGEMKLESELLNDDYTPKEGSVEGKPTFDDYQWNGQHCKSGVAFYDPVEETAKCANPELMWVYQNGLKLGEAGLSTKNWECDPTDNS